MIGYSGNPFYGIRGDATVDADRLRRMSQARMDAQEPQPQPPLTAEKLSEKAQAAGTTITDFAVGRINTLRRRLNRLLHNSNQDFRLAERRIAALEANWLHERTRQQLPYITFEKGVVLYNVVVAPRCDDQRLMPATSRPTWFWTQESHAEFFANMYLIANHGRPHAVCRKITVETPLTLLRLNENFSWTELRVMFGLLPHVQGSADQNHERMVQELFRAMPDLDGVMDERVSIGANEDIEIILNFSSRVRDKLRVENAWAIRSNHGRRPVEENPDNIECVQDTLQFRTTEVQ